VEGPERIAGIARGIAIGIAIAFVLFIVPGRHRCPVAVELAGAGYLWAAADQVLGGIGTAGVEP
jgi:hypothetical protein